MKKEVRKLIQHNKSKNPVAKAGIAGAVVGAAIGGAAAWALSKEENRKMIKDKAKNAGSFVKGKIDGKLDEISEKFDHEEVERMAHDATDEVAEKAKSVESDLLDKAEKAKN